VRQLYKVTVVTTQKRHHWVAAASENAAKARVAGPNGNEDAEIITSKIERANISEVLIVEAPLPGTRHSDDHKKRRTP